MGNINTACQLSNYSKRNMRIYIMEKEEEIDAFITSQVVAANDVDDHSLSGLPGGKKFTFRKDVSCLRVLASQTQEVPWEPQRFLSVFVEDEEDENICSKQLVHNMALSAPITVLLYDV